MILVLLPLIELGDHYETPGSDPEFVSVITVAAICLGFLLFPREIAFALRQLLLRNSPLSERSKVCCCLTAFAQDSLPRIRAPIRI